MKKFFAKLPVSVKALAGILSPSLTSSGLLQLQPLTLSSLITTQEAFCRQCRSRSDCTCAVWSLIYTVHIINI